ncbi:PIN domain-containing protein [Microbacterium sp. STN6]|uniref:PIN domain-containing protein n=1 Tax=Microbacterium sp. STN6 TaxID=2995588 RepID=UPI002260ED4A|nr:PIN domain-containing protein [Microbacterium sp. STN6]MCX7522473.1 PIN domain-containing protein [Microbacterium sp. STN6]
MSSSTDTDRAPIRVVLGDANVLYSRVLRDYLLYAADAELISIRWSAAILAEVIEHLTANLPTFDTASGQRLITAMTAAFPDAEIDIDDTDREQVAPLALPDEDDRHVLEAAVAAEAEILCTDNIKDFPAEAMKAVDIQALTADDLLSLLVTEYRDEMRAVHQTVVSRLPGATDESTLATIYRAGAVRTANLIENLLDG